MKGILILSQGYQESDSRQLILQLYTLKLSLTDVDALSEGRVCTISNTHRQSNLAADISQACKILVVDGSCTSGRLNGRSNAEHHSKTDDADIFVESNEYQAEEISRLSGKTVFCTNNLIIRYILNAASDG